MLARNKANCFVSKHLIEAKRLFSNSDPRSQQDALSHFSIALHTIQDATSPVHRDMNGNFLPWHGSQGLRSDVETHAQFEIHDPGQNSELYRATYRAYAWMAGISDIPTDIFSELGVDPPITTGIGAGLTGLILGSDLPQNLNELTESEIEIFSRNE